MVKDLIIFLCLGLSMVSGYGCALMLAGTVGGIGTAVWLSNKLVQETNAPFDKTVKAARTALSKLNLDIKKETMTHKAVQFISEYYDGKKLWVDIHQISKKVSKIEVRVGVVGDEEAAHKILDEILKSL